VSLGELSVAFQGIMLSLSKQGQAFQEEEK
jgi:hypothetical protein